MLKLSPSILSANFLRLGEEIRAIEEAKCEYLHVDVMDGVFVPSISFGMPILKAVRQATDIFLDVHLMIVEPQRYIEEFARCGADLITIHTEACDRIEETLDAIHKLGKKAGISINPETSVEEVLPYLEKVELILLMTVHPGFGGQKYIASCTQKIQALAKIKSEKGYTFDLEIDGGVNKDNFEELLDAGANVIVAGSAVFGEKTAENAKYFMEIIKRREKRNR